MITHLYEYIATIDNVIENNVSCGIYSAALLNRLTDLYQQYNNVSNALVKEGTIYEK